MSTIHYGTSELTLFVALIIRAEARPGHDLLQACLQGQAGLAELVSWWSRRGLDEAFAGFAKANAAAYTTRYRETCEVQTFSDDDLLAAARTATGVRRANLDRQMEHASLLRYNLDDEETQPAVTFCLEVMTAVNRLLLDRLNPNR